MTCSNCGQPIRWTETMGWVHGKLGSGNWDQHCDDTRTTEAQTTEAWS